MNKKKSETKSNNLENLIQELQKEFGEGTVMTLESVPKVNVETISTGSPSLDLVLGVGGLPRGRIIEIFGPESSGKSTLALETIAEAQKNGGNVAFIDVEHALDPEYAKRIGVDIKKIVISQPDSGEDALNLVEKLVKSGLFDVIVVDSVAALAPKAELEGEIGDHFIGLQARLLSQALRKLTALISKTKTILIFLNQTRAQIGAIIGAQETTPGGKALKFYSSVRIELKKIGQIKRADEIIGIKVKARIVKNKVAPPFKTAEIEIYYGEGISYEADLLNLAEKCGIIKRVGTSLFFGDIKLGSSFQSAREQLKQDNKLKKEIWNEIKKIFK
ncbi:MAG: protein RecA [Candidatus Parcubacteria bacterium]|nr:MAG: protein RecA [Candidatus Parcubacteria bacterium]